MGQNDALDGFNHRGWLDTSGGEGIMNLGQLVQLDGGIFRTLGLNQKPAHPAMTSQKTNSLQLVRQIDRGCTVINIEHVIGQTVLPSFGEVPNLGDGIEPPESADLNRRKRGGQRQTVDKLSYFRGD